MAGNRAALPDLRDEDVIGSPYCVREYVVDERFGGRTALAAAREALAARGVGLILDYVPNHVAPDHPWTRDAAGLLRARDGGRPRGRPGARSCGRRPGSSPAAAIPTSRRGRTWCS